MRGSFIILNYNRRDELVFTALKTKELIKDKPLDYEIIIVDNASTDKSVETINEKFPEIQLIVNPTNTGIPAWNLGMALARGEYFILLDDDSHIETGLEEGMNYMDINPDVGVLALNVFGGPYTKELWDWKDGDETVGFIGCGAILRKKVYNKIGGFAEWMFLYVNEWEYGLRCLNAGYSVKFFENSRVIHRASAINRSNKRFCIFRAKHEMGIVYKFFGVKRNKYLLTVAVNNLKAIRKGHFKIVWYNISGIMEFLKMRRTLTPTPVSAYAQYKFASIFHATQPVFGFLKRPLNFFKKKKSSSMPIIKLLLLLLYV